ncbi:MAG: cupin domain-containing protein [Janthinobacterium lividum]
MNYSFDDRNIAWRKFDFLGSAYFVYAASENEGVVDVLIRFPPHARGTLHRHTMDYITVVLQGELRFYRPDGELKEIRPTGSYTRVAANGEPHREGAGEQEAIVLFSIRGGTGPMFTIWEEDGAERILGFADFKGALDAQIESGDYAKLRG